MVLPAGKSRRATGDLIVKYSRQTLVTALNGISEDLMLTVSGKIGLVSFAGSDIITIIADRSRARVLSHS